MRTTIRFIAAAVGAVHRRGEPCAELSDQAGADHLPYPPGGPTDVIARLVAQKIQEHLGGQFYVENLSGAGGALGAGNAANSAPDGSTLLITTNDFAVGATTTKLSYDPVKNFAPVSIVASAPQVIIANPALPAKSLQGAGRPGEEGARQIQLRQHEHRLRPVDHASGCSSLE